jgi:type I restriction enzyme R subunit
VSRDPELVALDEVIAQISDLFSGDHPDSSVRNVVTHIKDRLEESETLQQQAQNNSLSQFSASPDLQNEFVGAVIGAMEFIPTYPLRSSTTPKFRRSSWGK